MWERSILPQKGAAVLSEPKFGPPQSKIPGSAPVLHDYRNENNANDFYESWPDSRRDLFRELYDTIWCKPKESQTVNTSSDDERRDYDWNLECPYPAGRANQVASELWQHNISVLGEWSRSG